VQCIMYRQNGGNADTSARGENARAVQVQSLKMIGYPRWEFVTGGCGHGQWPDKACQYWSLHNLGDATAFKKRANQGRAFRHSF
jgi:hypothetical protein